MGKPAAASKTKFIMTEDLQIKTLKLLLLAELTVEAMDDIKGTYLYKGKLKQHGNIMLNVLNPMLHKQLVNVYNEDPELTTNLFNNLDGLMKKLATMNVVDLTMINQIHDHYSKNPEDWQNTYNIEFDKLNT